MDNLQEVWEFVKLAVIGMLGAGFMALYRRKKMGGWKDALIYVVFGGAIAHFGAPVMIWLFSMNPENTGSVGFFLGAFGGCVSKWIWYFIESGELTALIKSRFGREQ